MVPWPEELGFRPIDMAALPDGGLVILDDPTPGAPGPARYWQLDPYLRVCSLGGFVPGDPPDPVFVPSDGGTGDDAVATGQDFPLGRDGFVLQRRGGARRRCSSPGAYRPPSGLSFLSGPDRNRTGAGGLMVYYS